MKKIVLTKDAPQPIGPYSQAVMAGNLLFISGQIPLKADGSMAGADIVTQTKQVLDNLGAILKCQDMTYENVVKTTVYLKDLGDFGAMNEIYGTYFTQNPPARVALQVSQLPKDSLVEIDAIALKD